MPSALKRLARVGSSQTQPLDLASSKVESTITMKGRRKSLLRRVFGQKRPESQLTIETSCLPASQATEDEYVSPTPASQYTIRNKGKPKGRSSRFMLDVPFEVVLVEEENSVSLSDDETYWEGLEIIDKQAEEMGPSAELCYTAALEYLEDNEPELALEEIQKGMECSTDAVVYCNLLRVHGEALVHMRIYPEALSIYQKLLDEMKRLEMDYSTVERANILYSCGQIATRLKDYERALDFFQQELHLLYDNPTLSARIYRELAIVHKQAFGDLDKAMHYYQQALTAESSIYRSLIEEDKKCSSGSKCPKHSKKIQDILNQIRDTKESIGRIYYEQGDLQKAVRFTMMM